MILLLNRCVEWERSGRLQWKFNSIIKISMVDCDVDINTHFCLQLFQYMEKTHVAVNIFVTKNDKQLKKMFQVP